MCENFLICNDYDFMEIDINCNKTYTLNKILKKTIKRIGKNHFYNWDIFNKNCKNFVKEILTTIHCFTEKEYNFISNDRLLSFLSLLKAYKPHKITVHIFKYMLLVFNCIEKYILDNNIFY